MRGLGPKELFSEFEWLYGPKPFIFGYVAASLLLLHVFFRNRNSNRNINGESSSGTTTVDKEYSDSSKP